MILNKELLTVATNYDKFYNYLSKNDNANLVKEMDKINNLLTNEENKMTS